MSRRTLLKCLHSGRAITVLGINTDDFVFENERIRRSRSKSRENLHKVYDRDLIYHANVLISRKALTVLVWHLNVYVSEMILKEKKARQWSWLHAIKVQIPPSEPKEIEAHTRLKTFTKDAHCNSYFQKRWVFGYPNWKQQ